MDRRHILKAAGAALLLPRLAVAQAAPTLFPIRFDPSQIFRTTVCLRPFRATGPRIEAQALGRKIVVHNYGHGGSGWSLSWGSADAAVKLAMQHHPKRIAVIGAGALGLTAAITAQRAGAAVTIYTKDRFPFVRSARATGSWTPDSRVAKTADAATDFGDRWEAMARTSYSMHQSYMSLPGNPVEWVDQYYLHTQRPEYANLPPRPDPGFIELGDRLNDIVPGSLPVTNDQHPFNADRVTRANIMSFNVADYAHQLTQDFLEAGGTFVPVEFHTPADLAHLTEHVIINCTGYGARALWSDETITPVRGQITWLPPQDGVHYSFIHKKVLVLARRDGTVVQDLGPDDNFGFGIDDETPDATAARAAVSLLSDSYRA